MKNLQTIVLTEMVLYSPSIANKEEIENRLKGMANIKYIPDSCEYREQRIRGHSWLFCNSLSYTIDDSGSFIVIKYTIGDNEMIHTIVTNDIFYIDEIKTNNVVG